MTLLDPPSNRVAVTVIHRSIAEYEEEREKKLAADYNHESNQKSLEERKREKGCGKDER